MDEVFKKIFEKYIDSDFIRVELLSESLEKINNKNYYILDLINLLILLVSWI